jgi:hypothetical protein
MNESSSDNKIVYINHGDREIEEPEIVEPLSDSVHEDPELVDDAEVLIDTEDAPLDSDTERDYLDESFEGGRKTDRASSVYDGVDLVEKPKASYASSESSNESMTTAELLSVDPLYFRLNLFLKSDEGENVANLLKKVCNQLETLNQNFDKLMKTPSQ